jgi:hypothetical protein
LRGRRRDALARLAERVHVPAGMLDALEYIDWTGEYKDLAFVPGATAGRNCVRR